MGRNRHRARNHGDKLEDRICGKHGWREHSQARQCQKTKAPGANETQGEGFQCNKLSKASLHPPR